MRKLTNFQKHLLGHLFDLMERLSLEVKEARILRKTLGYQETELSSLTKDIGARASEIRDEEDQAMSQGIEQEEIQQMEDFFKLGKVIHPDGWTPPK